MPQATQSNSPLFLQFIPQIVQIQFLLPLQVARDKGVHPPVLGVNGFGAMEPCAALRRLKDPPQEPDMLPFSMVKAQRRRGSQAVTVKFVA